MNLPNIKDILKIVLEKLSIFKNNLSLLIPVIIALVGILFFVPTQLLSRSLKNEIQQNSIDKAAKVIANFGQVITEEQLKAAQDSLNTAAKDANNIKLLAMQTTQRELLSYDIFSLDPNDANSTFSQSVFYEFGNRYCDKIEKFITDNKARMCPTQAEIEEQLKLEGIDTILQPGFGGAGRAGFDTRAAQENIQGIMIDRACQNRAQESSVYIDPSQISGYSFWAQFSYSAWKDDVENCWYSQLGYWVIEDIFDTILAMNKGSNSVVDAPVKRLMSVTFSDEMASAGTAYVTGGGGGDAAAGNLVKAYTDRPRYQFTNVEFPSETLTGRYSGMDYDVIHFKAKFVINTRDFMKLISKLCSAKEHKYIDKSGQSHTYKHNQITVLSVSLRSVDSKSAEHELYRYGDESVSEAELTCEYVLNVKGYEDIMPQSVKNIFTAVAPK